ncbi:glycosyltransferase family protein [Pontiella sulfatireligans]|uniref:Membrane protein YfhO n=1 Tax=Pontiella sulfatireligans TaxID=2750658 RepID=A0A6C2ULB6_9BACT|nr:YfhO family protein [Pontiella sulfatireligans]VGO21032.1 hypothetical protein SCARR_03101 [Pontiella sulfatireligans]
MKSDKTKFLLCVLFFVVLAAITFRCTWGADMVFSASDLNIGRLASMKNGLPSGLLGGFSAGPVLGGSGVPSPRFFNLLLSFMPLEFFANTFYGLVLVLGSISLVWFLRLWNRSWLASIFGALVSFWVNSIMLAPSGHAYKMEVLAFSVLGLCLIEKAVRANSNRRAVGFSLLLAVVVGIMMIEQQDVALLAGLFVGPYAIFRLIQMHGKKSALRWVSVLVPVALVSLLLSGSTVISSYKRNIAGAAAVQESNAQGEKNEKWNYITQWSMVPGEWPDLIASGWSGWSSNNPQGPYWGKLGQSAEWEGTKKGFRNFKLTSVYFGIIPFLLGAFGFVCALGNRKNEEGKAILFWSIAGVLGFLLAFGKYSLLYKLFFQLPMVGNIRAPIKLFDNFQICLAIVAAYGLDRLLIDGKAGKGTKVLWIASAAVGGLALFAGLKVLAFPNARKAEFSQMGFERFSDLMIENMANAWFHAALLSVVCAGLVFMLWKGIGQAKWILTTFVLVLAADSLVLTSHYFKSTDISSLKKGNAVSDYLKEHQGVERTFFVDQSGIYNQWLASDGPYHRLRFFNIWQMPRMPVEYKEYLGKVGRNQVRLWQLSAVKHVAAPSQVLEQLKKNPELGKQFKPVLNYKVPTAQGMRPDVLLEFSGSIPRFALFKNWESIPLEEHCDRLVSLEHDPQTSIFLIPESGVAPQSGLGEFQPLAAKRAGRTATIEVQADQPSVLRFSQRYEPSWKVFVDGKEAELLRVDYLCMGVAVPSGTHTIEFKCISGVQRLSIFVTVLLSAIVVSVFCLRKRGER